MKILAPISFMEEVHRVIDAGAEEIYCGIIDEELINKYKIPYINRRPFDNCNLNSFTELEKVVKYCHEKNVQVYVTLNEPIYTEKQIDYIECNLELLCKLGVDAVIVSDLALVDFINKKGYKINIHISTCASVYNSQGVEFCKQHGASRIILPRHMTIDEINNLVDADKNIEYEVIILNTNCQYDDGYCTYEHCLGNYSKDSSFEGGGCGAIEEMKMFVKKGMNNDFISDVGYEFRRRQRTFNLSCGACSIGKLSKMGIDSLKIVGREYSIEKKVKDIKFIYNVKKIFEKYSSEAELKEYIKSEYKKNYNRGCNNRCYY